MRRRFLVWMAVGLSLFLTGTARAQEAVQIFGGYSYLRPTAEVQPMSVCPAGLPSACTPPTIETHPSLNGLELSGTYNAYKLLGFTADFSRHYGTVDGSSLHLQTYLFGPQVHFPGPISPFAHALIGAANETLAGGGGVYPSSATALAVAVGAGLDIHVAPLVSLRVIQLDDLVTRFGSATQNQPRASAGVVIHF